MSEPNVLLLDEPTNDLDIETLTALEDLLDHWPGTLVVVSHDRYFVERVADNVFALDALGGIRHLPGGIDQYLGELREPAVSTGIDPTHPRVPGSGAAPGSGAPRGAQIRQARKDLRRLERQLERLTVREQELHTAMAASAGDHQQLRALSAELDALLATRERAESDWLETASLLEN
jgi:ATP-binding cassette subfamily F protein uup